MTIKDITEKILSGDFKSLIYTGTTTDIHPADVAKILDTLPVDTAYTSFIAFPQKKKAVLFAYLGAFFAAQDHMPARCAGCSLYFKPP